MVDCKLLLYDHYMKVSKAQFSTLPCTQRLHHTSQVAHSLPWTLRAQSSLTLMPSTTTTPLPRPTRSSFCHHFLLFASGFSASDSLSASPPFPLSAPTTRMMSCLSHVWSWVTTLPLSPASDS